MDHQEELKIVTSLRRSDQERKLQAMETLMVEMWDSLSTRRRERVLDRIKSRSPADYVMSLYILNIIKNRARADAYRQIDNALQEVRPKED